MQRSAAVQPSGHPEPSVQPGWLALRNPAGSETDSGYPKDPSELMYYPAVSVPAGLTVPAAVWIPAELILTGSAVMTDSAVMTGLPAAMADFAAVMTGPAELLPMDSAVMMVPAEMTESCLLTQSLTEHRLPGNDKLRHQFHNRLLPWRLNNPYNIFHRQVQASPWSCRPERSCNTMRHQ